MTTKKHRHDDRNQLSWCFLWFCYLIPGLLKWFLSSCLCLFFYLHACGTVLFAYCSVSMPVLFNFFSSPAMLIIYFFSGPRICFLFIPYWILYSRNSMGILFFGPSQHNLVEAQSVDLVRWMLQVTPGKPFNDPPPGGVLFLALTHQGVFTPGRG